MTKLLTVARPFRNGRPAALLAASLYLALAAPGCLQQDSTDDTVKQDVNRQRATATTLSEPYDKVAGQFTGTLNNSDILLSLSRTSTNPTGNGDLNLVPQPSFAGSLAFTTHLFVSSNSPHPFVNLYPINSGAIAAGSEMNLAVLENGTATTVICKVSADNNTLACDWYPQGGSTPKASFSLDRVGTGSAKQGQQIQQGPIDPKHFDAARYFHGTYSGSSSRYDKIAADFKTMFKPQAGGSQAVPVITITGNFTLMLKQTDFMKANGISARPTNFEFQDGNYDPMTSTIAITLTGLSNPMQVNCVVANEDLMHCTWTGMHDGPADEDFDLALAN